MLPKQILMPLMKNFDDDSVDVVGRIHVGVYRHWRWRLFGNITDHI